MEHLVDGQDLDGQRAPQRLAQRQPPAHDAARLGAAARRVAHAPVVAQAANDVNRRGVELSQRLMSVGREHHQLRVGRSALRLLIAAAAAATELGGRLGKVGSGASDGPFGGVARAVELP